MAWYDEALQRAKGLYQQGTNYFTGNNLTSEDPSVRDAMALDALGTNNQLQDQSFSDRRYEDLGGVHPPLAFPTQTRNLNYNIHRDPPVDWRENIDINRLSTYPRPHQTNMRDISGEVGEYGQIPGQGNVDMYTAKKGFQLPNIGFTGILRALADKMKRSPEKQAEIDEFNKTGMFGNLQGNMWDEASSGLGKISLRDPETGAVLVRNKNVDSLFGSKTIQEMEDKKRAWIKNRILKNKPISKVYEAWARKEGLYDPPGNVTTGGGYRDTSGWGRKDQGYTTRGGFTGKADPTSGGVRGHHGGGQDLGNQGGNWGAEPGTAGAWGPGARDGGRIGYQNGELVTDESMMEATPAGFMQENVEEVQGEPSREQLEVLAMEIFQLPLEELNEEQLIVVYKAAMQQEPMEEAVQEEDVQFAARGGLAGLL